MKLAHKGLRQRGFTLVEIMVGLVIGMLATIVIIQVLSVFETQKRSTTGTADAQTNGSIALYNISREMQNAGYPLMPAASSALECTNLYIDGTPVDISGISPVTITDGVDGASDSITIRYGTTQRGGVPSPIGASPVDNVVTLGTAVSPGSNFGCAVDDVTLIVSGTTCALSKVSPSPSLSLGVTPPTVKLDDVTAAAAGANFACLGTWNEIVYRVSSGSLQRAGVDSVADIVNIQAQYGISAAGLANTNPLFNQVTQWVDATAGDTWETPSVTNRNRIKAIRIAIVARNAKLEPADVSEKCSGAALEGPCSWVGGPEINLLDDDANWKRYRYRVFETIIPLRNMFWSKDTL
ncbi:Prokaryotic N-terminal methylation site [Methylophilaceae bacterium]